MSTTQTEPETYQVTCAQGHEHADEDSAFSCSYWSDRARAAEQAKQAEREMWDLKGKQVEVVRGRKAPLGTTGEVFWVGESHYGGYRVGMKTADGETHWTAASNVAVREEAMA